MKVETATDTELKAVPFPKGYERQFAELMTKMTEAMAEQFKNNTLKKLNKGTIEKFDGSQFEDAQIGNYANIFLGLSKKVSNALLKRFSNERLDKEVKRILLAMDRNSSQSLYNSISGVLGIDSQVLSREAGVGPQINALIAESQEWVKRLRDENLALFQNATLRTMALGESMTEVINQYNELTKDRINRATFTARQQAAVFNSLSSRVRAQKLGITKAVWVDSDDSRVRPSHADRDGKEFDLSKGCWSSLDQKYLQVGEDWNCRCIQKFILPGSESEDD